MMFAGILAVIPAKAGIQSPALRRLLWVPAFAGTAIGVVVPSERKTL